CTDEKCKLRLFRSLRQSLKRGRVLSSQMRRSQKDYCYADNKVSSHFASVKKLEKGFNEVTVIYIKYRFQSGVIMLQIAADGGRDDSTSACPIRPRSIFRRRDASLLKSPRGPIV